tara:strand:- start:75 stop:209 length:135 start_codon:yes stop_codon:yes gene_type:complete
MKLELAEPVREVKKEIVIKPKIMYTSDLNITNIEIVQQKKKVSV